MYKRLIILTVIIVSAFVALTALGYVAVGKWAQGLQGARLGQFAEVSEQIRQDVKNKLDVFLETEQKRPYTDYQYYSLPPTGQNFGNNAQQITLQRSPLAGQIESDFAEGFFQIEPGGSITTLNDSIVQLEPDNPSNRVIAAKTEQIRNNVKSNLLPVLERTGMDYSFNRSSDKKKEFFIAQETEQKDLSGQTQKAKDETVSQQPQPRKSQSQAALPIESLQQRQKGQVVTQSRMQVEENIQFNAMVNDSNRLSQRANEPNTQMVGSKSNADRLTAPKNDGGVQQQWSAKEQQTAQSQVQRPVQSASDRDSGVIAGQRTDSQKPETVQIRIEPFTPIVTTGNGDNSIFGGQIFFIRHIQIEDKHFVQGFKFNEAKLTEAIEESAKKFVREGMGFQLSRLENTSAAYSATLDFGFGRIVMNLQELVPDWISRDTKKLEYWYFGIVIVVFLAVTAGLLSLWLNARAQLKLAEKKDDFISAVSHELRTPLTSIRMYTEMLQKDWIKSDDKRSEYYNNMQQESERLSRLVENVLDFSRIQKGRKKYSFTLGNINESVQKVIDMMRPYAQQRGFVIKEELAETSQSSFDRDCITQIVVNLIDNATKYARDSADKTIIVRTGRDDSFTIIEVEDHGPGVPHRQRKKVFEEFYRIGSEATRETQGTGLGLAIVKKFAEAHNGFVEVLSAKPSGAIFRVGLALQGSN